MRRLATSFLVIPLLGAMALPAAGQSTTTTEELLAGMVTEEIEPGVRRVINDGVRDLPTDALVWPVAGKDGGVWLLGEQGFIRLGTDGAYAWPNDRPTRMFAVAPDGTVWTAHEQARKPADRRTVRIRSFDGERWTERLKALDTSYPSNPTLTGFTVTADGDVWASWADPETDTKKHPKTAIVARFGADGWEPLDRTIEDTAGGVPLFVTDAGEVWAVPPRRILRYADGIWESMAPEDLHGWGQVGPDGTVWYLDFHVQSVEGCPRVGPCVVRHDGSTWQGWVPADYSPDAPNTQWWSIHVAPDGSLWRTLDVYSEPDADWGLARFDGAEWRHFLTGHHVWSMDIAADGSVWAAASSEPVPDADGYWMDDLGYDLYAITPEAVAAVE